MCRRARFLLRLRRSDRVGDIRGGIRNPSLGDTNAALQNYRTSFDLREALLAASPNERELQKELSTSHIKIGDMLTNTGDVAGAHNEYREALRIRESLANIADAVFAALAA